jgi:hypothetical protein
MEFQPLLMMMLKTVKVAMLCLLRASTKYINSVCQPSYYQPPLSLCVVAVKANGAGY